MRVTRSRTKDPVELYYSLTLVEDSLYRIAGRQRSWDASLGGAALKYQPGYALALTYAVSRDGTVSGG